MTGQQRSDSTGMIKSPQRNPVSKALKALDWLIRTPDSKVGVRQMASALDLTPSNAHRLLNVLSVEGFVQRDAASGRYSLGLELLRWAHLVIERTPIHAVALPRMRALVADCNETALLGIYDGARQEMMFAASVESLHPLRYVIELDRWFPITAGASGLAIMAFLPEDEIDAIIKRTRLMPRTPNTITDPRGLKQELAAIRKRGFAVSRGQREPGAIGLGAPIFGLGGKVVGDLMTTIPEQRFDKTMADPLGKLLIAYAALITQDLGGVVPAPR